MMGNKPSRYLLIGLLALWSIVSVAALMAMYKLWWERERVNYLGNTFDVQRRAVLRNGGLSETLADVAQKIDLVWPRDVAYTATGDHNQLSYLKYLLIPRIPSGSPQYSIDAGGVYTPPATTASSLEEQKHFGIAGLALFGSLSVFAGITLALMNLPKRIPFSFPELFGCALLLCMGCVVVSRSVFATANPAFYLLTSVGIVSWCWLILKKMSRNGANLFSSLFSRFIGKEHSQGGLAKSGRLFLILIIALGIFWSLLMSVIVVPDDWDAWAIWAAKAKVLALGHGPLFDVSHFGHADYPLLWPSIWAFSGWFGGGWEEMWSRGWGGVFLLLCVWEIVVIIERLTGRRDLGLLGGALFVSIPMVPLVTSWSYAEAPFWLLTTACVGCLLLQGREGNTARICIAGLLAAAAAFTKNEGVMFAAIVCLWMISVPVLRQPKNILVFVATFCLCYFPWFYWTHIALHLDSHAVSGLQFDMRTFQRALSRVPAAVEAIARMWADAKLWNIVLWLCLIFAFLGAFNREGRNWLIIPFGMLLGYFIIIIFHQAEIYWQVGTSWNRLTIHTLPLLIIGGVMQARRFVSSGNK